MPLAHCFFRVVTAATVGIHDINQECGADLPEEGATTIGGLIIQMLGDLPDGRVCMVIGDMRVEVLSIKGDWIRRVRLTQIESD